MMMIHHNVPTERGGFNVLVTTLFSQLRVVRAFKSTLEDLEERRSVASFHSLRTSRSNQCARALSDEAGVAGALVPRSNTAQSLTSKATALERDVAVAMTSSALQAALGPPIVVIQAASRAGSQSSLAESPSPGNHTTAETSI